MNTPAALTITRIAHCCTLIDFNGHVVLTDPWFSEKFGYHRGEPLGVELEKLPRLAAVVISHDHYDHNDMESFSAYPDKEVPIFAEGAAARKAHAAGFRRTIPLAAWKTSSAGPITVTAVPALHGVPEIGFVLQAFGFTVYFAGDTLLIPELRELAERFPLIDAALLPLNGLRVFGKKVVMDAQDAAELCVTIRPRVAIPTHYAFRSGWLVDSLFLKYSAKGDELQRIFLQAVSKRAPNTRVEVLAPGQKSTVTPLAA